MPDDNAEVTDVETDPMTGLEKLMGDDEDTTPATTARKSDDAAPDPDAAETEDDTEADDEDSDEETEETDEEDDDEEVTPKTQAKFKKRLDKLIKQRDGIKNELEAKYSAQVEELQEKLQRYEASQQTAIAPTLLSRAELEAELDSKDSLIDELRDAITGLSYDDEAKVRGKPYPVQAVKARIDQLREEKNHLRSIKPTVLERERKTEEARKANPAMFKAGTPEYAQRRDLLKEFPGLRGMPNGELLIAKLVAKPKTPTPRLPLAKEPKVKSSASMGPGAGRPAKKPSMAQFENSDRSTEALAALMPLDD
jgi:hypothetical protein